VRVYRYACRRLLLRRISLLAAAFGAACPATEKYGYGRGGRGELRDAVMIPFAGPLLVFDITIMQLYILAGKWISTRQRPACHLINVARGQSA